MERHIGKRLGIPCAVISAPVHVQDFPARYSPQVGWEGANVIFDTWIHPLVMGLEEHLLHMFRDDFEFNDAAGPSHHGRPPRRDAGSPIGRTPPVIWLADAEKELRKVPFFVRGKARRNTERFAPGRASPRSRSTRSTRRRPTMRDDITPGYRVVIVTWTATPPGRRPACSARLAGTSPA